MSVHVRKSIFNSTYLDMRHWACSSLMKTYKITDKINWYVSYFLFGTFASLLVSNIVLGIIIGSILSLVITSTLTVLNLFLSIYYWNNYTSNKTIPAYIFNRFWKKNSSNNFYIWYRDGNYNGGSLHVLSKLDIDGCSYMFESEETINDITNENELSECIIQIQAHKDEHIKEHAKIIEEVEYRNRLKTLAKSLTNDVKELFN